MSTRSSEAGWNWQTTLFWASHSFQNTPKQSEFEQTDYLIIGKRMKVLPLFQKKRGHKTIKMEQVPKKKQEMERFFFSQKRCNESKPQKSLVIVPLPEQVLLLRVAQLQLLWETLQAGDVTHSLSLTINKIIPGHDSWLSRTRWWWWRTPGPQPSWAPPASLGRDAPPPWSGPCAPVIKMIRNGPENLAIEIINDHPPMP